MWWLLRRAECEEKVEEVAAEEAPAAAAEEEAPAAEEEAEAVRASRRAAGRGDNPSTELRSRAVAADCGVRASRG